MKEIPYVVALSCNMQIHYSRSFTEIWPPGTFCWGRTKLLKLLTLVYLVISMNRECIQSRLGYVKYHTIPYRTVPYRTVPYRTVPYRTVPYRTVPYRTVPYHTIPYHTIPYHTIPYHSDTIPYHTIQVVRFLRESQKLTSSLILYV